MPNMPGAGAFGPAPFVPNAPALRVAPRRFLIAGITRDSAGDPLSDVTVELYETRDPDIMRAQVVSGIDGSYSIEATEAVAHRAVAKKLSGDRFNFYFHTDTTRNGAPTAPTGCATLSEDAPEITSNSTGGHRGSSGPGDSSVLNKPFTSIGNPEVAGLPSTTAPPISAEQFGWFTDVAMTGTFNAGQWLFRFREQDDGTGITGRPVINMFAATGRDFSSMRHLAQFESTQDWWAGTLNTQDTYVNLPAMAMTNEYLFIQLWCHEVGGFIPAFAMAIYQEGSELADNLRMRFVTAPFATSGQVPVAGATLDNLIGVAA